MKKQSSVTRQWGLLTLIMVIATGLVVWLVQVSGQVLALRRETDNLLKAVAVLSRSKIPVGIPVPKAGAKGLVRGLDTFLQTYSKAPTQDVFSIPGGNKLVHVFSVKMSTVTCKPQDQNDPYGGCCDPTTNSFTPTLQFYAWPSSNWQQGGSVQFYLDPFSGFCADGGFLTAQGPFNQDLLKLSQDAKAEGLYVSPTTPIRRSP